LGTNILSLDALADYQKVYEMIDEASIFPWPQNLEVMMDFEM